MKSVPHLQLEPRPSRLLASLAVVVGVATAVLLSLSVPSRVGAFAIVVLCGIATALAMVRSRRTPRRVIIAIDRRIIVTDHRGETTTGVIADATYVTGLYTAVVWRPHRRVRTRVWAVAPDCLDAEDRRRLRLWLRYAMSPPEGADPALGAAGSKLVSAELPASQA